MNMTSILLRFGKLAATVRKSRYFLKEYLLYFFSRRSHIRILFSDHKDWVKQISGSFRFTKTDLDFKEISEARMSDYDLVVPLRVNDLAYLSDHPDAFPYNAIPFPSSESLDICNDKALFDKTLRQKGFASYLPAIGRSLRTPYMLKKKSAEYGEFCFFIPNEAVEKAHEQYLTDPDFFRQQIIRGPVEYATHILFRNGSIAASLNIKYVFRKDIPIKGKDGYAYRTISDCPHLELFAQILKSIGFEGLCCFNYKEENGKPYILEINPRFGGSLCMFFFSFIRKMDINTGDQDRESSKSSSGALLVRMPVSKKTSSAQMMPSSKSRH